MSENIEQNIKAVSGMFNGDYDFVMRELILSDGRKAAVSYIGGLASSAEVSENVIKPLIQESTIGISELSKVSTYAEAVESILNGDTIVFIEGFEDAICCNTKGFQTRSVTEPQTETVLRGPREGFTESIQTNTALIRRKLKSDHLRMEAMHIGKRSNTVVCLCWLDDLANPKLIDEIKKRLKSINADGVLSDGYIEEYIEDPQKTLFQTTGKTEKPDVVAAKLLEGRCALVVDGTPFVLTMPMLFVENFHSPEDYALRTVMGTFLRVLRVIAFVISTTFPSLYVAMVNYHPEFVPTPMLFTIAAASEGTPFALPIETAVMLLAFEVLREAGIRLPRPAGQAVSIVGALVMGQAAIDAGIVGAPVVIIIAFSAVSGFVNPAVADAASICRWLLLLTASVAGGFGLVLALLCMFVHLTSLSSYGAPFMHPLAPFSPGENMDSIVRFPLRMMTKRPSALHAQDNRRKGVFTTNKFGEGLPNAGDEP